MNSGVVAVSVLESIEISEMSLNYGYSLCTVCESGSLIQ